MISVSSLLIIEQFFLDMTIPNEPTHLNPLWRRCDVLWLLLCKTQRKLIVFLGNFSARHFCCCCWWNLYLLERPTERRKILDDVNPLLSLSLFLFPVALLSLFWCSVFFWATSFVWGVMSSEDWPRLSSWVYWNRPTDPQRCPSMLAIKPLLMWQTDCRMSSFVSGWVMFVSDFLLGLWRTCSTLVCCVINVPGRVTHQKCNCELEELKRSSTVVLLNWFRKLAKREANKLGGIILRCFYLRLTSCEKQNCQRCF